MTGRRPSLTITPPWCRLGCSCQWRGLIRRYRGPYLVGGRPWPEVGATGIQIAGGRVCPGGDTQLLGGSVTARLGVGGNKGLLLKFSDSVLVRRTIAEAVIPYLPQADGASGAVAGAYSLLRELEQAGALEVGRSGKARGFRGPLLGAAADGGSGLLSFLSLLEGEPEVGGFVDVRRLVRDSAVGGPPSEVWFRLDKIRIVTQP